MAESLSGSPIGSAPVSEFERLLVKEPSVFDKLVAKEFKPAVRSDFDRLLEKDFKPATKATRAPKVKFAAKLGVERVGLRGAANLIGLLMMEKDIEDFLKVAKNKTAKELGFETEEEMKKALEDVSIGREFASIATEVLTQTKSMLEWKKRKRREKPKRTVIYGWSRK